MKLPLILIASFALHLLGSTVPAMAAEHGRRTENILLITLDGLRWQEVFQGADPELMDKSNGGIQDTNKLRKWFGGGTVEERREALLPFFWTVMAKQGQVFGNQKKGSIARVTNGLKFSYPGYNEMLTGRPDSRVNSNAKILNPNVTVLEWLNGQPAFKNRVAAFCAWDVFPFILNRGRSGLFVRAGWEWLADSKDSPRAAVLNELSRDTARLWEDEVYDSFIFLAAADYLKKQKPRVFFVSFGETDEWAHAGRYDQTLISARRTDDFIRRLWNLAQSMRQYRGKTTLILTTDHGRGSGPAEWKNHGQNVPGAEDIWMAFLGPDTESLGERSHSSPLTQSQIAATIAAFLGQDFPHSFPEAALAIREVLSRN